MAQRGVSYPENLKKPQLIIYESGKVENYKVKAQSRKKAGEIPTANFVVNYTGFSDDAKAAFAEAVNLWSYLVGSRVTIEIDATWKLMEEGVLGGASAGNYRRDFKDAPYDSVFYPAAIVNRSAGFDVDTDEPDIVASFNKDADWYLGLDGNCPSNKTDFISVVMHEIGHGLGFAGSANVDEDTGMGEWGVASIYPFIYDMFVYNEDDEYLIDTLLFENPSVDLKDQYTSDIYFKSELSTIANGGNSVPLYAPGTWNGGSSYSHLGEIYNRTENAMMTWSIGWGEVEHHPGPVMLAMFAEMGWMNVFFEHNPLTDLKKMNEPLIVEAEIFSDSSLIAGSVKLHYSVDNFATESVVVMKSANDTLFNAEIPVLGDNLVSYYLEATNDINRTYYLPSQGNPNVTTVNNVFTFIIGPDATPPVITHQQQQLSIFSFDKELKLNYGANDNFGLDTTYIEYKVNAGELIDLQCEFVGYSDEDDLYFYESAISVESLVDADTVYYRIIARDFAQVTNTTILPGEDFFKVAVRDLGTAVEEMEITFDEAGDENLFIGNGLSIMQPEGFTSKALHSPHPYLEGQLFPGDEIEYSAMLKTPIILKENEAYLRFDQIVLVEPGTPGNSFGDDEFWDYVIVEGSIDSAKTWFNFEDGYDCKVDLQFATSYNKEDGNESMYLSHVIDLLANENLVGNDNVLIRFRLWSDPAEAGWGWAIDNIEIQPEIISVNDELQTADFKLYPNPSKGGFNLDIVADELIDEYSVSVYNLIGEQVYAQSGITSSKIMKKYIDITDQPAGVYFVKLNAGDVSLSRKIVVE
jgi:hypothetical protein